MLNYQFYCWGTISLILRKWNLSTKIFKLTKHPCFLCPRSANWRWDNFIFIYFKFDPTSKKKLPSPFPLYTWIVKSTAQEGPVPAKSFYGDVDPITSLKVLKAVPTLKSAFSARAGEVKESPKEPATKKKQREELQWLLWVQEYCFVCWRKFWNSLLQRSPSETNSYCSYFGWERKEEETIIDQYHFSLKALKTV